MYNTTKSQATKKRDKMESNSEKADVLLTYMIKLGSRADLKEERLEEAEH